MGALPRVVFLLGAGFSHSAGMPVMSSFADASQKEFNGLIGLSHKSIDGQAARSAPLFLEAGRTYEQFRTWCSKAKRITQINTDDMEAIFCLAEAIRESCDPSTQIEDQQSQLTLDGEIVGIDFISEQIRLWLWKVYQRFPAVGAHDPAEKERRSKPYDEFFREIKAAGILNQTTFLTTNYDMVIEHFCWKAGISVDYPGMGDERIFTSPDRKRFTVESVTRATLCKLHGSINFFEGNSEDFKRVYATDLKFYGAHDELVSNSDVLSKSQVHGETRPAILMVGALHALRQKYGPSIIPALIPPTYSKLEARGWLRAIWEYTVKTIRDMDYLVIIGYGLPKSDGFMRAMLNAASAMRERPELPSVYVIDPTQSVIDEYCEFFSPLGGRLFAEKCKFEDAILNERSKLRELLRSLTRR